MKNIYLLVLCLAFAGLQNVNAGSNPYDVLYTIMNTRCSNGSCHSATSDSVSGTHDNLKFDQSSAAVYNQMFNIRSSLFNSSVGKHEFLVNPEMPYQSFLLRKIAGAGFDTDLSIDTAYEGQLMVDTGGQPLKNYEIEYFRQWIRYGALTSYSGDPQPDFATYYQYYNDTATIAFLAKPAKPAPGTGLQFRMGPMFMPVTGAIEQEITEQQVVYFPYLPEIYEVDGHMNNQSHHMLLFQYPDSTSARDPNYSGGGLNNAPDINNVGQVTPVTANFAEPFSGNKNLTAAFQTPVNKMVFPSHTALFWDQKTYLDFDFHVKNYNATTVLPCDFYLDIYFRPRNPNTIEMVSQLENNNNLGKLDLTCGAPPLLVNFNSLPQNTSFTGSYNDGSNKGGEQTKYLFMAAGHTHKFGKNFYLVRLDTVSGAMADTIYDGSLDYANIDPITGLPTPTGAGFDWHHPPIEYWTDSTAAHHGLMPVVFGKNNSGMVARTEWLSTDKCVRFGFTTNDEMQLYYYMYTSVDPASLDPSAVTTPTKPDIYFEVMPNPMTNEGKIVYNLAQDSKVEASVVDITGKTVAELAQENEQMGLHTLSFNNGRLASGIYFAKLVVDGNFYTKKFVVTE